MALPAWAAAIVAGSEAAAIVAEAAEGAVAEVARTNGDTARAYLLDATTLGLPAGPLVAVGVVIAARPDPMLLRRRLAALRAIGPRWSSEAASSKAPWRETRPQVGFRPVTPLATAG